MKFYVASQSRLKKRVQEVQDIVKFYGHEVTFDWTRTKEEGGEGIIRPNWRHYQEEGCAHSCRERDGVKEADVLILLLGESGFGPGSFIEFGIAAGTDTEIWVVGREDWDRDSVFFCLPNVMHLHSDTEIADHAYLRREQ